MSTPAPAPPAQKTEKAAAKKTVYYVLSQVEEGTWKVLGNSQAPNVKTAIIDVAAGREGTYIGIPARSYKKLKLTVETTKTVRLG